MEKKIKTPKKQGRPRAVVDQEQFEELCALQCTEEEIMGVFGILSPDTMLRWIRETYGMTFKEIFRMKSGAGKVSLRRTLEKMSKKNPRVAIHLSKNRLGMTDQVKVDGEVKGKVQIEVIYGNHQTAQEGAEADDGQH